MEGRHRRREGAGGERLWPLVGGYAACLVSIGALVELRKKPTGWKGGHCCKDGLVGRGSTEGRCRGRGGDGGHVLGAIPRVS